VQTEVPLAETPLKIKKPKAAKARDSGEPRKAAKPDKSDKASRSKAPKVHAPRPQVAALPYRMGAHGLEVMLVTSRETRRWVIPKGWTKRKVSPGDMAMTEAYEEAGLIGRIRPDAIGCYHYDKKLKTGKMAACRVDVFAMQVTSQLETWPEKHERAVRWFLQPDAAQEVIEPELQEIIREFRI
jgi:8-oxo-dGTP pyrophosphatase MutT (NUDIX family)